MAYIDDRIAELEQRIAEKKAYQRMYPSHKYASTWDYVAEGDRSGFDRMDAEEAAYRNMLAQQAQQNAILKAQQEFNARENEFNRKNAKEIAAMSRTDANIAKLDAVEKELNNLLITKQTLDAQGKDSREVTARIEQIYKNYPSIERPQLSGKFDPRDNPDYQLAKFSKVNAKNTTVEGIIDAINTLSKYKTPEAARRLAELDMELEIRKKADESGESLRRAIEEFDTSTGNISDYLTNHKFTVKVTAGGYKLVDPNGNVVKSPKVKNKPSWN